MIARQHLWGRALGQTVCGIDLVHRRTLTFPCQSCKCGRSQVLRGRPDWGHTAGSRWTGELKCKSEEGKKFKAL